VTRETFLDLDVSQEFLNEVTVHTLI
jgi:hypothetical protein